MDYFNKLQTVLEIIKTNTSEHTRLLKKLSTNNIELRSYYFKRKNLVFSALCKAQDTKAKMMEQNRSSNTRLHVKNHSLAVYSAMIEDDRKRGNTYTKEHSKILGKIILLNKVIILENRIYQ